MLEHHPQQSCSAVSLAEAAAHALALKGVSRGCIPNALLAYPLAMQAVQQLLHRALLTRVGGGGGIGSSSAAELAHGNGYADEDVAFEMLAAPDDGGPSGRDL